MNRLVVLLGLLVVGMVGCGDDKKNPTGAGEADLRIRLTGQEWYDTDDNTLTFAADGTWQKVSEFGPTVDHGSWELKGKEFTLTSWEDDSVTTGALTLAGGMLTWKTKQKGTINWYDEEQ